MSKMEIVYKEGESLSIKKNDFELFFNKHTVIVNDTFKIDMQEFFGDGKKFSPENEKILSKFLKEVSVSELKQIKIFIHKLRETI